MSRARRRDLAALTVLGALLLAFPAFAGDYAVSLAILVLFAAYLGAAWNIMMGFAGLLSLGHALYFGLGAYLSAALFLHAGLSPWLGMALGAALATAAGLAIGALSFRFRVGGVYFALLTIAFAEFVRILADHVGWIGASSGLFLPVEHGTALDLAALRGGPVLFYYLLFAATLGILVLGRLLLGSRIGYYWLAIREDEAAAQASGINVFRCKLAAIALSAGLTAPAGTLYAFYYANLLPETIFALGRSIELMLPAIIGGLGTLCGPLVGAVVLTLLSEGLTQLTANLGVDGLKQLLYGVLLGAIVLLQPAGLWPLLARRLGLAHTPR